MRRRQSVWMPGCVALLLGAACVSEQSSGEPPGDVSKYMVDTAPETLTPLSVSMQLYALLRGGARARARGDPWQARQGHDVLARGQGARRPVGEAVHPCARRRRRAHPHTSTTSARCASWRVEPAVAAGALVARQDLRRRADVYRPQTRRARRPDRDRHLERQRPTDGGHGPSTAATARWWRR